MQAGSWPLQQLNQGLTHSWFHYFIKENLLMQAEQTRVISWPLWPHQASFWSSSDWRRWWPWARGNHRLASRARRCWPMSLGPQKLRAKGQFPAGPWIKAHRRGWLISISGQERLLWGLMSFSEQHAQLIAPWDQQSQHRSRLPVENKSYKASRSTPSVTTQRKKPWMASRLAGWKALLSTL